jgi:hypothetical protein
MCIFNVGFLEDPGTLSPGTPGKFRESHTHNFRGKLSLRMGFLRTLANDDRYRVIHRSPLYPHQHCPSSMIRDKNTFWK